MTIYIVERESVDGLETDLFTDRSLAEQWRDVCGGDLREEETIDRETLDAMSYNYHTDEGDES